LVCSLAPDIVVEVVSTHTKAQGVNEKAHLWLAAGVKRCWVIWLARRRVEVWRLGDTALTIEELGLADMLTGEDIVPFALPVHELFKSL
jgi:Uma2 family endonuclease